ncbi:MAG: hypothetical protein F6K00_18255 [Leptolyngbya sp. SIOISBB]|nr:hypothetical protein [Leptolyngbya sp. SIOISBB]
MFSRCKRFTVAAVIFSTLMGMGLTLLTQPVPSHAQAEAADPETVEAELLDEVLSLRADVLATIREAPFSELFTVTMEDGATGYGVKDQDFDPTYDGVGFYSLWGKVPDHDVLQVAAFYCLLTPELADAELEALVLMDDDIPLITIDQKIVTTPAQMVEVAPERYEPIVFSEPFYDPIWGLLYSGDRPAFREIYFPAVDCSVGGGRFDLMPVQEAIAQLPTQTLDVQLQFSNGLTETWHLGQGTVEQIKVLPTL